MICACMYRAFERIMLSSNTQQPIKPRVIKVPSRTNSIVSPSLWFLQPKIFLNTTLVEHIHLPCAGTRALHGYSVYGDENSDDCYGHGTHVAAIVGGLTFGVAKNVTLYAGTPMCYFLHHCGFSGSIVEIEGCGTITR